MHTSTEVIIVALRVLSPIINSAETKLTRTLVITLSLSLCLRPGRCIDSGHHFIVALLDFGASDSNFYCRSLRGRGDDFHVAHIFVLFLSDRHGRIQERSGPEMYTVSCATSSLLPLLWAPSFHRVDFGRCSPSTTSTTQRTSSFPNPRRPLVSVSSRSGRIRKLLPQLHVCVFRLVTMVRIWCTRSLGRLNLLISCFATARWSAVTLDPGKKQMNNPFYYSLTR